jgi:hypothetical protein
MSGLDREIVSADVWRSKTTDAIIGSIEVAASVLNDRRLQNFKDFHRRWILEVAKMLIDLAK